MKAVFLQKHNAYKQDHQEICDQKACGLCVQQFTKNLKIQKTSEIDCELPYVQKA